MSVILPIQTKVTYRIEIISYFYLLPFLALPALFSRPRVCYCNIISMLLLLFYFRLASLSPSPSPSYRSFRREREKWLQRVHETREWISPRIEE